MIPVVYHPAARAEQLELTEHFLSIDPDLCVRFDERLRDHILSIQTNPELYHERQAGVRRVNLTPRFEEYYIAYVLWQGRIVVLAIGHAKRRPFYFFRRINQAKRIL
jgi:plasmid stabilization system protein ParE